MVSMPDPTDQGVPKHLNSACVSNGCPRCGGMGVVVTGACPGAHSELGPINGKQDQITGGKFLLRCIGWSLGLPVVAAVLGGAVAVGVSTYRWILGVLGG